MTNKRTLKRIIHGVCEELFAEAMALSLYGAQGQKDNATAQLFAILKMEDDYLRRVSHPEPGMKANKYYKALRESFAAQVSDIMDQMNG